MERIKGWRRSVILIVIFLLLVPVMAVSAGNDRETVIVKFSPGGMQLSITVIPSKVIFGLDISYCDGTTGKFRGVPHIVGSFNYFDDKPMKKAVVYTVTADKSVDEYPTLATVVKRGCDKPSSTPKPYCNNVQISSVIHRSAAEPISFSSNRYVYKAGLQLPGVDGVTWIRTVTTTNHGLGYLMNLKYMDRNRVWTGTLPSTYIPIGSYKNGWLVILDEFGNQAKCRLPDIQVGY